MKYSMKNMLALLLSLMLLMSLGIQAFAAETDPAADAAESETAAAAEESCGIIDGTALTAMLDEYVKENGLSGKGKVFSIGFCYTPTGDTWYYDADQWCYSASLYKVPTCMLLAEKEYNGEITADTQISSQYANGTVDHMEQRSIVYSDNYTGHAVVEYLGGTYNGKCADMTTKFTELPADYFPADFKDYSYYSARYFTQVLKTLYFNSDQYPRIMDYMKQDQQYHYLDKNLEGQYQTAQKYGAFEEKNGNKNYHSAGVIYTPNPIIVTIMTKNITGFEKHIGNVAKMLVDYTLQLDANLATYTANLAIAQQQEQARLAAEEQERLAAEAAAQQAAQQAAIPTAVPSSGEKQNSGSIFLETPQQTVTPTAQTEPQSTGNAILDAISSYLPSTDSLPSFTLPVIIGLVALAAIFLIVFLVKLRKARLEEEEYDEEDYDEYMRGDLSELAPKESKKKTKKRQEEEYEDEGYEDEDLNRGGFWKKRGKDRYEDTYEDERQYDARSYKDQQYDDEQYDDEQYDDQQYDDSQYDDRQYDDQQYGNQQYDDYDAVSDEQSPVDSFEEEAVPRKISKIGGLFKKTVSPKKKANAVSYEEPEEEYNARDYDFSDDGYDYSQEEADKGSDADYNADDFDPDNFNLSDYLGDDFGLSDADDSFESSYSDRKRNNRGTENYRPRH